MSKSSEPPRVYVGMSGGVDSAVSAAILGAKGYDVTGVFIKIWQPEWTECTWREERLDAMRAAAHIGIPFLTVDLTEAYKREVIDLMIAEYRAGRTPNPDIVCNRSIKFGAFYDWARSKGADMIATGHYARIQAGADGLHLLAGKDKEKDQSYFLYTISEDVLKHVLFPVGGMTKPEVRTQARKFRLPNAEKKDSQGLCFIGKVDFKEFLGRYVKTEPGVVLDGSGEAIGTHPGALFFTMGERHGFETDRKHKTPQDSAYYVVDKDMERNTITVSTKDAGHLPLAQRKVRLTDVNWVHGPPASTTLWGRHRYRQKLAPLHLVSSGITEAIVEFETPQESVTAGQSLVIYDAEECLGGGIIAD